MNEYSIHRVYIDESTVSNANYERLSSIASTEKLLAHNRSDDPISSCFATAFIAKNGENAENVVMVVRA